MRRRRHVGKRSVNGQSGVMLGNLTELVLADGSVASHQSLKGLYLAWMPHQNELAIVKKKAGKPAPVSRESKAIFKKFHQSNSRRAATYEWPIMSGRKTLEGLIRSLTYVVPQTIKSPGKHGARWVHAFGDHGESGHGPVTEREKKYPERLMPALYSDAKGNLIIKRRSGNKYKVTEWIYW